MEINSEVEVNDVDQATLLKMSTRDNKEEEKKELYLEHLRLITSDMIKTSEIEQIPTDLKA